MLKSKKSVHVSFVPLTNGTSVFATGNTDLQYALEHHYRYGTLFRLSETEKDEGRPGKKSFNEHSPKQEPTTVKVSDISAAKDYLARTFGISRTALRTSDAIISAAKSHNIVFDGI